MRTSRWGRVIEHFNLLLGKEPRGFKRLTSAEKESRPTMESPETPDIDLLSLMSGGVEYATSCRR